MNNICLIHKTIKVQRFKPNGKVNGLVCLDCRNEYRNEEYRKNPEKTLLISARTRATKACLPCNITEKDIVIPTFCPILNIPIFISNTGKPGPNSPSLDKHLNYFGYQIGNVSVIFCDIL